MKIVDKRLRETADVINKKFAKVNEENRGEVSGEILSHLRNFCEAFMYKVYDEENDADIYQTQDNLTLVRKYIKDKHYDVWKFHSLLDSSVGHMDFGPMQSEALTLKYIPQLIRLKTFLQKQYGIGVLENIDKYPLDLDNGITIVCSELIVNGKKFILKNPQIVNGCQTCNVLYDVSKLQDSNDLLGQVKVILKIIATSNDTLVNNVVRGTNKQNIVQDEAFETIRGFHKNLEEFFISANELYKMPVALYYERRAKQYDNSKIKEIQKVTFSSLIRSFIAIFLSLPHKGVNHPASLLKEFTGKIFIDTQSLLPYYVAPQVNYFIDKVNKTSNILGKSKNTSNILNTYLL